MMTGGAMYYFSEKASPSVHWDLLTSSLAQYYWTDANNFELLKSGKGFRRVVVVIVWSWGDDDGSDADEDS
jgi:hypothetical protein